MTRRSSTWLRHPRRLSSKMSSYFLPHIDRMTGYVPGEQPRGGKLIKLNTNENPYPPSPRVAEAIKSALDGRLRLYPDPVGTAFREAVGRRHGVDPNWVLAGNGSDDILTIVTRAFAGPGHVVVYPSPSYILYKTLAELQDAEARGNPLRCRVVARSRSVRRARRQARLPRQSQQPLRHSPRDETGRRDCLQARLSLDRRRGLRRLRRFRLRRAGPRTPERARLPDLEQRLKPGGPAGRLPDRASRDHRGAAEGEGFVQLRHAQPARWRRRARRHRRTARRPARR